MRERNVPLVSVIIPTYNSARTLPMALRSIKRVKSLEYLATFLAILRK
jgi:glycosyltransferase involved in cell wall biosynthesis